MAGAPYEAGGIAVTTEATRAAPDDELLALARARQAEALAAGITHQEIKSGYGLTVDSEARLCRLAGELTDDVTFLGAHLVPSGVRGTRRRVRRARLRRDARGLRAALQLDRRLLRARRLRRRAVARGARGGARGRASACACTATSSARARASRLAVEMGAASVDHCTYLSDDDIEALAAIETVATFLPGDRLLDPPALSRRSPRDRRRRLGRDRDQHQPRLQLHDLDAVLHRARRPRDGHDDRGGARRRRRAAAPGRCGATTSAAWRRAPAPTPSILDAPSYTHLIYRPGVPLVRQVVKGAGGVSARRSSTA